MVCSHCPHCVENGSLKRTRILTRKRRLKFYYKKKEKEKMKQIATTQPPQSKAVVVDQAGIQSKVDLQTPIEVHS